METRQTTLRAQGIKCEGCATAARAAVGRVAGVQGATISVSEKTITVIHTPATSSPELALALTKAGFPAE